MKRIMSLLAILALLVSITPAAVADGSEYIAAPYTIEDGQSIEDAVLTPVFYENADGPTIGVTVVGVIAQDGLYFRDSNNNQQLDVFEDWRLDAATRAEDTVSKLTVKQQVGLIFNTLMANPAAATAADAVDEDGNVMFEKVFPYMEGGPRTYGNQTYYYDEISVNALVDGGLRAGVLRANPDASVATWYNNALAQVCEYAAVATDQVSIPWTVISNPIGNGYPGSLGMAAAVMGDVANGGDYGLVYNYADQDRQIWNAKGIDVMYGPQIDLLTDPRWNRNSGTYGEVPEAVAGIVTALVTGYQTGTDGTQDGDVSLNIKHFPGDGAAENGFESHNAIGQWRVYPTEGSLEKYQLVGFQAAVDANTGGIMPGYSRPAMDARSAKQVVKGVEINAPELGNAYNKEIQTTLLRDVMGFKGSINSDSGIVSTQNFGAEDMTQAERYATIIAAGTDIIGSTFDVADVTEALDTGLLSKEDLDRASINRLTSIISMGRFENPYRDTDKAVAAVEALSADIAAAAYEAQQKSVVLMKNTDAALPLTDTTLKAYVGYFGAPNRDGSDPAAGLKAEFAARGFEVVDDYTLANIAFLAVSPSLNNSQQMAVIDLVEDLEVPERSFPDSQALTGETVFSTTVPDIDKVPKIAEAVHANGGKVLASIEISNPWILTNLEPYCDGLIGVFGTSVAAQLDVLTGVYNPTGKLPVTMVASNDVIAVSQQEIDGVVYEVCVSPNDVPGYAKDEYMSADVLALSPSGSYAYQDMDGNIYSAWFGLSY